ncbi:TadA family conjugal transfer-associated ATPase [Salinibacterium sp. NG253]|uniref:TadA family conjugal transfer-associated ATPase n=1 Tax=Salinibacterium sp. NG253 TaxID=2792039 RepID=UPI0018CC83F2|nr:TadA family conjugal transfer-associated ATPase [Salinibacterium sp. NG253]MBH0117374.1 TadA family conjugal transfer-associated ATPase [Salinibacterium sp. NG253]
MTTTPSHPDIVPFVARRRFTAEPTLTTNAHARGVPVAGGGAGLGSGTANGDALTLALHEFGPLAPYVGRPNTTDVFVNGAQNVWIDRGGGLEFVGDVGMTEADLRALAIRLINLGGRHVDEATPCVDVRLAGGVRVHAVLPPISATGTLLSIRVPSREPFGLAELDFAGFFNEVPLQRVKALIDGRENVLISGASGAGKTTFLGALLAAASDTERIVAIEDVAELRVEHPHFVSLEARQANLEGAGGYGLPALVREALRMRPDRLVVGECRGAEIRELLSALNTGHDGGAGTLHANSLKDVPSRLEALGALAGLDATAIARQAVSAIGAVLHVDRVDGRRRLTHLGRLVLDDNDRLAIAEIE